MHCDALTMRVSLAGETRREGSCLVSSTSAQSAVCEVKSYRSQLLAQLLHLRVLGRLGSAAWLELVAMGHDNNVSLELSEDARDR